MDEFDTVINEARLAALKRCNELGALPRWRKLIGCPPLKYLLIELAGMVILARRINQLKERA